MSVDRTTQELSAAVQLHRAGKLDQAGKLYAQLRIKEPRHFDVWHLSGTLSLQLGRPIEAVTFLGQAHQLKPKDVVCLMRLGLAEAQAGQHRAGVLRLERALALKPDFVEAWDNLGVARKQAGDLAGCIAAHRKAVTVNAQYAGGWFNLGIAHAMNGEMDEARVSYERAIAIDATFRRAASARLFTLQYDEKLSREDRFAAHKRFGDQVRPKSATAQPVRQGRGRLRIGFISSDLRQHSIPSFIEPILRHLDRTLCDVALYFDYPTEDAISARLKPLGTIWRNVFPLTDAALETTIRTDSPEILIDLSGHSGRNRLPLFARRLAPIQATYLGYPDTTGLAEMDYRLTDGIADPVGDAEAWHTEELIRFSPCAWAYQPAADAPAVPPLPCLTRGYITFGSFNHVAKINPPTAELWASVLNAVPQSRLVVKSMGIETQTGRARVEQLLQRAEIDLARVTLMPALPSLTAHLATYGEVDVTLDPFPYHGTTTTCEALWMGRPVISLMGDRHASRVGGSLVSAVGHPEWAATSPTDYVRIAAELAAHPETLSTTSLALREQMSQSVLMDHAGQAQRFVQALLDRAEQHGLRPPVVIAAAAPAAVA